MGSGFGPPDRPGMTAWVRVRSTVAYYVYLLASRKHGTLYLGVTNDLIRRIYEHKSKAIPGFTSRYGVDRLVWFECYDDPVSAIAWEKEIKKWRRDWKIALIERDNPDWLDLYDATAR
jgi:putative endonuclease